MRGLCFDDAADLATEFWEVEGARGWDAFLVAVVADDVMVLATDAGFFTGFSWVSDFLRLIVDRGAIGGRCRCITSTARL